ncbi:molybdopterin-binding protein [Jiella mangrovi]|uniref:Molybdopterin-binding protein n=1 Tax=Jiella mangrovi TaxID=2821407 RepID=A0ABS4BG97_9HYPH|nr:molybdopterin-binding protein [Jiella mangrovi]MBP0615773.1 molybdopterin-binding protein [Jiella mangrovi]
MVFSPTRRGFLTAGLLGAAPLVLSGCDVFGLAQSQTVNDALGSSEDLARHVQRLLGGEALAPEFEEAEMSPLFRTNGNIMPADPAYQALAQRNFAGFSLAVDGLVERPMQFTLAEIMAMPSRTQITRHDCVEGWSAIGKWTGVPLSRLLGQAGLKPNARYVVFHCADDFSGSKYYESIDLDAAHHPQTILAYGMNNAPLPIPHGAPLRLRVERQLGYKQAKFVTRIESVASLDGLGGGRGGYWEDAIGYDWYAGI